MVVNSELVIVTVHVVRDHVHHRSIRETSRRGRHAYIIHERQVLLNVPGHGDGEQNGLKRNCSAARQ